MKTYKIYNPVLDKYSSGAQYTWNLWNTTGKAWTSLKKLNSHFKMTTKEVLEVYKKDNCVLITYDEVSRESVEDFIK